MKYIYILKYTIYEVTVVKITIQCETTYIKPYHVKGQGFTPWTSCVTKYADNNNTTNKNNESEQQLMKR